MFGGRSRTRAVATLCAGAVLAAAGAGCGDEDEGTKAKEPVDFAAAQEPSKVFMERMAKQLATSTAKGDCAQLDEIDGRSLVRFGCPAPKALRKSMKRFEVVGAKEYGTGGIVDYKSGDLEEGGAIVLFVGPDRQWGVSRFGVLVPPSTSTSDEAARDGYQEAAEAYLKAVRDRDCKAYIAVSLVEKDTSNSDVCKGVFAGTAALAKRMKKYPQGELKYEGGNGRFGFLSFETGSADGAQNVTISVVRDDAGGAKEYVVLDAVPSVTSDELARVEKLYLQQQREKKKSGMGSKQPLPRDDGN